MKYIKNILIRLDMFTLSPFFPLLLGLIIFIICRTFDSPNLCDDKDFCQLKVDLSIEIFKLNNAISMKEMCYNSYLELINMSRPNCRNFSGERDLMFAIQS